MKIKNKVCSIVLLIILLPVTFLISKSRTFQFFGGLTSHVETNEKVVALTFDDGPTERTEYVLKILDELNVKATFFVTGQELEKNMDEGIRIVEMGHELGNHTYSHKRMILKSYSFIETEIEKTDELIRSAGYSGNVYFRPPFCKKLFILPYYLSTADKTAITWNIEPETNPDIAVSSEKIIKYVNDKISPGSIILLHVMYDSRVESLEAIKGIVESLRNQGYSFKTVSELLMYQEKK